MPTVLADPALRALEAALAEALAQRALDIAQPPAPAVPPFRSANSPTAARRPSAGTRVVVVPRALMPAPQLARPGATPSPNDAT